MAALGLFFVYTAGIVLPEQMWGAHFMSFLPAWQTGFFLCLLAIGVWVSIAKEEVNSSGFENSDYLNHIWFRLRFIIPLLSGVFVNIAPLVVDVYGDSFSIIPHFQVVVTEWTPELARELLSYDLTDPKIGEMTFYAVSHSLGYLFGVSTVVAARYLEVFCVILFSFFYLGLVTRNVKDFRLRIAVAIVGFLAPLTLVFHAHTEMYALPFTVILGFLLLLNRYYDNGLRITDFLLLVLVFLFSLKFHVLCAALFPALLFGFFGWLRKRYPVSLNAVSSINLTYVSIAAGVLLTGFVYVFVTDSVNGTRWFSKEDLYSAVFLPINALEGPPLDRYNLFSSAHILDYVNMAFAWSPVSWLTLIAGFGSFRKTLKNSMFMQSVLVLFVAYMMIFFLLNPLLSMSWDWDLFFFPGLFLMVLSLSAITETEEENAKKIIRLMLIFSLANLPLFLVHLNKDMLSARLETIGVHEFKTYWKGSSSTLEQALELEEDSVSELRRRVKLMEQLEPYVVKGSDSEYAELLRTTGVLVGNQGNLTRSLELHLKANECAPLFARNTYDLITLYFKLNKSTLALPYLNQLIKLEYPNPRKAFMIALHISVEAERYLVARKYCEQALKRWPNDSFLNRVRGGLASENPSVVKKLFASQ